MSIVNGKLRGRKLMLHHCAGIVGGYLGGYALFNYTDIFPNAQTANLIKLVLDIFSGRLEGVVFLFISFLVYVAGNMTCFLIKRFSRVHLRLMSLIITSAAIAAVGLIPDTPWDYIRLYPLVFAMPVLWNGYKTVCGWSCSVIFSSNNVREASISLISYITDREPEQLAKTRFYWAALLFFHIGVASACLCGLWIGRASIWLGLVPAALAFLMYFRYLNANHRA